LPIKQLKQPTLADVGPYETIIEFLLVRRGSGFFAVLPGYWNFRQFAPATTEGRFKLPENRFFAGFDRMIRTD